MTTASHGLTRDTDTGAMPSLAEAFRVWLRIGLLSFGGPAGQIAMMHRTLVEERRWLDEGRFLHALNYCMLLPGPEAQQLATYIGWLMHRTVGGLVAGILFILPGALVMLGLSLTYALYADLTLVQAGFVGVKAAVLIVVVEAVLRIGRKALKSSAMYLIAGAAFCAIFIFGVPFPVIVAAAALFGLLASIKQSSRAVDARRSDPETAAETPSLIDIMAARGELSHTQPSLGRAVKLLLVFICLWAAPIVGLFAYLGPDHVFAQQATFFSKLAVVTFGGAYAVLAYMAQQAVEVHHWLSGAEMLDGLGLAETTPGPLILVTQFVGFLAGFRHAGGIDPLLAGVIGSAITLWVTFTPCFLWIFLGAPYIEWLRHNRYLSAALSGITAAVVGVILNLALWFGVQVIFAEVGRVEAGGLHMPWPVFASLDPASLALTVAAAILMLCLHQGVLRTLSLCAAAAVVLELAIGGG